MPPQDKWWTQNSKKCPFSVIMQKDHVGTSTLCHSAVVHYS